MDDPEKKLASRVEERLRGNIHAGQVQKNGQCTKRGFNPPILKKKMFGKGERILKEEGEKQTTKHPSGDKTFPKSIPKKTLE